MGIVLKESYKNVLTLLLAILIGAVNTLFLYVYALKAEYYGLVTFLLSTAFILKPLVALGVNHSIIKFFSAFNGKKEKDAFLSTMLWWPFLLILPLGVGFCFFYESIALWLSKENVMVKNYTFYVFIVAIANAYFEIFYAWARVHLKSVFGNMLKEIFVRLIVACLLIAVYFGWINDHQFILCLVGAYFLQTLLMMVYAFRLYLPKLTLNRPNNFNEVIKYSVYIILAASAATLLLDIDKFMIPQKRAIEQVAFYAVAVYIGSVIEIPGRAMAQIVQPLTAKALNENKCHEVLSLYQKTSINLIVISGFILILVNANIHSLYQLLPHQYAGGVWVVLMISIAKFYHMFLGNCGSIISNSKYYKILLPYGIAMALSAVGLNYFLIDVIGINGAALATLLVVLVFNSIKLGFVKSKFNMHPVTKKTGWALLLIAILLFVGTYVEFNFHPILNIMIKSIVLTMIYFFGVIQMKLSANINQIFLQIRQKLNT